MAFQLRDAIVAFIRANPGKVGTREIAREFGLKNADRAELKRLLRDLAEQGTIQKQGRKVIETAQLPATLLADVTTRDADGELIATPAEWDEDEQGEPPRIRIHIPRHAQTRARWPASATARCSASSACTTMTAPPIAGASSRSSTTRNRACSACSAALPDGGGRLIPVDKKQAGKELNIAKNDTARRAGRRPRQRRSRALARLWPRLRQGQGAARLDRERKGHQPDRDPCPRHSHGLFARRASARPRKPSPPR